MLDHFFPLLFPKDSEYLKILDIRLWEVGAKRTLSGTSKVNRQTHRWTDKHTDRRTFRLIESIGPEGRCFENLHVLNMCNLIYDLEKMGKGGHFKTKLLAAKSYLELGLCALHLCGKCVFIISH